MSLWVGRSYRDTILSTHEWHFASGAHCCGIVVRQPRHLSHQPALISAARPSWRVARVSAWEILVYRGALRLALFETWDVPVEIASCQPVGPPSHIFSRHLPVVSTNCAHEHGRKKEPVSCGLPPLFSNGRATAQLITKLIAIFRRVRAAFSSQSIQRIRTKKGRTLRPAFSGSTKE